MMMMTMMMTEKERMTFRRWPPDYHYRQDAAKRQTAGIKFTHRPKIRFFAPQGRLVAPIHIKLCRTDGHVGPLSPHGGGNAAQKYKKNPLFGKESPRRGDSFDRFPKFLGTFIRLTILHFIGTFIRLTILR